LAWPENKEGRGKALPAVPRPISSWNESTARSTLPIHGTGSIDPEIDKMKDIFYKAANSTRLS